MPGDKPATIAGRRSIAVKPPYERLKEAIMSGELAPGQQLVEASLAEWCQVSRTPIREALTRLTQDGLVERGPRGLVVKESSPEDILDLYETRIILETAVSRMAAERRSRHNVNLLRRLVDRDGAADQDDPTVMAEWNAEFHRAVWAASHNGWIIDLLERLHMHVGRYPETTLAVPGRWETALAEHRELVDAIEDSDLDRAEQVAAKHFTAARDIRMGLWQEQGRTH